MTTKDRLRRLVDALPDGESRAAERYLQYLRDMGSDPVAHAVANAPVDDEPLTDEDRAAIEEGRRDLAAGRAHTTEDLLRALDKRR